jgi:hypothetical protein
MAVVNYTPLLGLALPTTGDLVGIWGTTVNTALTSLLDTAIAGTTTISTDADVTLTDTDGSANQARAAIINWTATGTVTRNITAPAASKIYVVFNNTGGTQSIRIRGTGPTTGVTILPGDQAMVAWSGTDFERVGGGAAGGANTQVQFNDGGNFNGSSGLTWNGTTLTATNLAAQSMTLSGSPLAIASGGTNTNATPTLGGVAYGTGSAYALTAAGTTGKVLTSNGAAPPTWEDTIAPVVAGGALLTNKDTVTESYVIPVGTNAFSVGPITIADTYTVTVSAGQRWLVV